MPAPDRSLDERADVWLLCARLGIPYSPDTVRPGQFLWDGATLHGRMFPSHPASRFDLLHEVAHWLTAEPEHRSTGSFGFGRAEIEPVPDLFVDILTKQLGQLLDREAGRPHYIDHGFVRSMETTDYGRRALRLLASIWEA